MSICDVVRALATVPDFKQMMVVHKFLAECPSLEIIDFKDRINHRTSGGWADLVYLFRIRAEGAISGARHIYELQLALEPMVTARSALHGHVAYAKARHKIEMLDVIGSPGDLVTSPPPHSQQSETSSASSCPTPGIEAVDVAQQLGTSDTSPLTLQDKQVAVLEVATTQPLGEEGRPSTELNVAVSPLVPSPTVRSPPVPCVMTAEDLSARRLALEADLAALEESKAQLHLREQELALRETNLAKRETEVAQREQQVAQREFAVLRMAMQSTTVDTPPQGGGGAQ